MFLLVTRWLIFKILFYLPFVVFFLVASSGLLIAFPLPFSPVHYPLPTPLLVPLQTPEELDDSDFETEDFDVRSRTSVQTEDDQLIAGQSARVSCLSLPVGFIHFFAGYTGIMLCTYSEEHFNSSWLCFAHLLMYMINLHLNCACSDHAQFVVEAQHKIQGCMVKSSRREQSHV